MYVFLCVDVLHPFARILFHVKRMKTTPGIESDDRLANAANQTTRSYVTVNRPSGQGNLTQTTRPRTHPGIFALKRVKCEGMFMPSKN